MNIITLPTGNSIRVNPELANIYSNFEPLSAELLAKTLVSGMTFVDVGANVGFFSAIASRLVGENGRVFAIEANPKILRTLQANVDEGNVTVINTAVGSRCGTTRFYVTDDTVNSGVAPSPFVKVSDRITLPMATLDSLLDNGTFPVEGVNFIKVDVQGDEVAVLQGAKELVGRSRHLKLLVEWAPQWMETAGYKASELPDLLQAYGFKEIYVIDEYLKETKSLDEMQVAFSADKSGRRFCNVFASK